MAEITRHKTDKLDRLAVVSVGDSGYIIYRPEEVHIKEM